MFRSIILTSICVGLTTFAAGSLHLVASIMTASNSSALHEYVEMEMGCEMLSSAALGLVIIFPSSWINHYGTVVIHRAS